MFFQECLNLLIIIPQRFRQTEAVALALVNLQCAGNTACAKLGINFNRLAGRNYLIAVAVEQRHWILDAVDMEDRRAVNEALVILMQVAVKPPALLPEITNRLGSAKPRRISSCVKLKVSSTSTTPQLCCNASKYE